MGLKSRKKKALSRILSEHSQRKKRRKRRREKKKRRGRRLIRMVALISLAATRESAHYAPSSCPGQMVWHSTSLNCQLNCGERGVSRFLLVWPFLCWGKQQSDLSQAGCWQYLSLQTWWSEMSKPVSTVVSTLSPSSLASPSTYVLWLQGHSGFSGTSNVLNTCSEVGKTMRKAGAYLKLTPAPPPPLSSHQPRHTWTFLSKDIWASGHRARGIREMVYFVLTEKSHWKNPAPLAWGLQSWSAHQFAGSYTPSWPPLCLGAHRTVSTRVIGVHVRKSGTYRFVRWGKGVAWHRRNPKRAVCFC